MARLIKDRWLVAESAKGRGHWHPLYDWLEEIWGSPVTDPFLDALEAALTEPLRGRVQSRRNRLVQDAADYWSALCELYLGTCLHRCGFAVTLGDPDVIITADGASLAFELTAFQRTRDLDRLIGMLSEVWRGPGDAVLETDDWELRLPLGTAEAVVDAFQTAATGAGPGGSVTVAVPNGAASLLQGSIEPGVGAVRVRSGATWGFPDLWSELEPVIDGKRRQLAGQPHGVIAVELGHADPDSHLWRVAIGLGRRPALSTDPNIDGVLVYWQDIRRHCPTDAIFVGNAGSPGVSPLLGPALSCMGLQAP